MSTTADYIDHCDDECFDLGALHYTCPCCHRAATSYDFLQHHAWQMLANGTEGQFRCEACRAPLLVDYYRDSYRVRPHQELPNGTPFSFPS